MRVGVHLPLVDFGDGTPSGADLRNYTRTAYDAGFSTVSANDHLVWKRPWLDGPTVLASVCGHAGRMTLATSVALPVVRHPVVVAKAFTSLALVAEGPVVAGLGPGSSAADYAAVGVPFGERWPRFDESFRLVRALLRGEPPPDGAHYHAGDVRLDPLPPTPPQVWFGSWGSETRLRRLADVADGWFASAYNTTPERFAQARSRLDEHLRVAGRDPRTFPDAVATMWTYVTEDDRVADAVVADVLAPLLDRDPDVLRTQVAVGPPDHVAGLLDAYRRAGTREVLLWPVRDPVAQLEAVAHTVLPHLPRAGDPAGQSRGVSR